MQIRSLVLATLMQQHDGVTRAAR
nr:unnamed protein product [Callosobruchus chinensis]